MKWIRVADHDDVDKIRVFLNKTNVVVDKLEEFIGQFLIMEDVNEGLVATVGIDHVDHYGLLRSLVLSPKCSEEDVRKLFEAVYLLAFKLEVEQLFLVTNNRNVENLFALLGFTRVAVENLPEILKNKEHVGNALAIEGAYAMVSEVRIPNPR